MRVSGSLWSEESMALRCSSPIDRYLIPAETGARHLTSCSTGMKSDPGVRGAPELCSSGAARIGAAAPSNRLLFACSMDREQPNLWTTGGLREVWYWRVNPPLETKCWTNTDVGVRVVGELVNFPLFCYQYISWLTTSNPVFPDS